MGNAHQHLQFIQLSRMSTVLLWGNVCCAISSNMILGFLSAAPESGIEAVDRFVTNRNLTSQVYYHPVE
jgi:hypothetical protein